MGDHHYTIGHQAIPAIFFRTPNEFIQLNIYNPSKIQELWDQVGIDLGHKKEISIGLKIVSVKIDGRNGIIILFPKTINTAECIMSACLIVKKRILGIFPVFQPRYITLEYGFSHNDHPRSFLCEWDKNGRHRNYGKGTGFVIYLSL